jgi:hypothetical protein
VTRASAGRTMLPFVVVALAACATATTSSDGDRSADFSRFKTYAWKEVRAKQDPAVEAEIVSAVDSVLVSRGLRKVSSSPDLWVVEHTRLSSQAQVSTYDSGWGYSAAPGWGGAATTGTVSQVSVGDLLVDLVDAANQKLVWRGSARQAVDPAASAERRERMIADAVAKMFAGYPPKP